MVLKRKRSDSEISSSGLLLSSPLSSSNFMSINSMQSNQNRISTPSLFTSRTRKRHRDNRPSESDVHQHTLSLLFSAQQNPQPEPRASAPSFQEQLPISSIPESNGSNGHQSSLHSFWAIPSSVRQTSPLSNSSTPSANTPLTTSANNPYSQATNCEDCDACLNVNEDADAMDVDVMMDIDTYTESGPNYGCTNCGKQICRNCAVSNLGAERKCLMCAGKKKWVGGLGWMDMD